jgi:hypothetical protein
MAAENVLQQWREGERRLRNAPSEQRPLLERVSARIEADLRRRLGGTFRAAELVELYERGTGWTLDVAVTVAPEAPWAWDARTVGDAAFARYVREAADWSGGRIVELDDDA